MSVAQRLVVCVTGASGSIYASRLLHRIAAARAGAPARGAGMIFLDIRAHPLVCRLAARVDTAEIEPLLDPHPALAVAHDLVAHELHAPCPRFLAFSPTARLAFGYTWRRADFPWMGIWEENHSRTAAPWNGRASRGR